MSLHISNGVGNLYEKESPDFPAARINYNLMETDATKYNKQKWWGEFSTAEELKHLGNFLVDFEDARRGECVVIANTEGASKKSKTWYYHFNGRGTLSKKR